MKDKLDSGLYERWNLQFSFDVQRLRRSLAVFLCAIRNPIGFHFRVSAGLWLVERERVQRTLAEMKAAIT